MTSTHRLIAIMVVWLAFGWTSFFMFGLSMTLFLPPIVIITLSILFVCSALAATLLIIGIGAPDG